MLQFDNTEIAFQSKTNKDLRKAILLYRMVKYPFIVKMGKNTLPILFALKLPIEGLIKKTVFQLFCGGESIRDCKNKIDVLAKYGVKTILDYSVEGKESEADFDAACKATIDTIVYAHHYSEHIPFSVFKPTALGRFKLWEKANEGKSLSEEEQAEFKLVRDRFYSIAEASKKHGVPVLIDAEESWIQTAVDQIAMELMGTYNKEKPLIYNTLQMYRWDRLEYLKTIIESSKNKGFHLGLKIVRGAYMEKERDRAEELNYTSPIQKSKADTDKDYDAAISLCVENINNIGLVAGTHNEGSSRLLFELMQKKGIDKTDSRIFFSQLLGMSDNISYNLASEGVNVVKYVPFGPVKDVMPYLLRRAEENTSVGGQTGRELSLLQKELNRRSKA